MLSAFIGIESRIVVGSRERISKSVKGHKISVSWAGKLQEICCVI
jgi:hypothetical protein